jgi:hypothetical protein
VAEFGPQLGAAVRQAVAEAAGYLAQVTGTNPKGSADALLARPDTDAVLRQALDTARQAAEEAVRRQWEASGAAEGHETLAHLLADVDRIFGSLAHLHGIVRHAHASVPQRHFARGVSPPGSNPQMEAAGQRANAVQTALLNWGRQAALRAVLAERMAEGGGRTAAALAQALDREARGELLLKRWTADVNSPTCCLWCRRLHGVTIGLRESFTPYLGGPVAMPHSRARKVATRAGERRYGLPVGAPIIYTQPPRPYRGRLQGPLLHPRCRCRLEIIRTGDPAVTSPETGGGAGEHAPFISADDIRDMPEQDYQADLAFVQAAVLELNQVLKRLAGGGG